MKLSDYKVLGEFIAYEFDIKFTGLSRIDGNPMFDCGNAIPKFLIDNFSFEFIRGEIKLNITSNKKLNVFKPSFKVYKKVQKLKSVLENIEEPIIYSSYAEYISKQLKLMGSFKKHGRFV